MKKLICVFVCLLLILPSALADTPPVRLTEDNPLYTSLYERSMELAWLFNEALHSDGYVGLSIPFEEAGETLKLLRMQDFTQPVDVTIVRADRLIADGTANRLLNMLDDADLSPALAYYVRLRFYNACGAQLASIDGAEVLSLSSALELCDAYICPEELDGPCFAVMQYGGLYAYLVTFFPTANGTVIVNARFISSRAADELSIPIE